MTRRSAGLQIAAVVVVGVVIGIISSAVLRQLRLGVSVGYCCAAAIAVLAVARLGRAVLERTESPSRPAHGATHGRPRPVEVLAPTERRLAAAARERRLFITGLQPGLYGITRDRLRISRHVDLDRAIRDGTARDLLGEELWHWLTIWDEDGKAPTPAELERLVSRLEQL